MFPFQCKMSDAIVAQLRALASIIESNHSYDHQIEGEEEVEKEETIENDEMGKFPSDKVTLPVKGKFPDPERPRQEKDKKKRKALMIMALGKKD